jgi:hypothetical protein
MKQYKLLSLALLLSAPTFAMQVPLPTEIHDSSGSPETAQAILDRHTFGGKEICGKTADEDPKNVEFAPEKVMTQCDYESDSEKGLNKENTQLYRFNKYVNATTQTLNAAQPSLMAWFKNPEDDKTLEKLPELSKKLEDQTNRIEAWLKQIGSYTAAYSKLRNTIKAFENSFDAAIGENQEKFKTRLVGNFSHPATIFLRNFEALQELVNKNS